MIDEEYMSHFFNMLKYHNLLKILNATIIINDIHLNTSSILKCHSPQDSDPK